MNTNPIGQRLRLEMKKRGLSSAELAKRAEVKTSFIYDIVSGKSANPSPIKLARLAQTLEVDLNYLAGAADAASGRAGSKPEAGDYIAVPCLQFDVSVGGGAVVTQEQEAERYRFRREWIKNHLGTEPSDLRLLYVRGDSMEPTLCHNDIVLVDTAKKIPAPPGIFVLFDGFGLAAKRLEPLADSAPPRLRILCDNPQYSICERAASETRIIGRVVWFSREI